MRETGNIMKHIVIVAQIVIKINLKCVPHYCCIVILNMSYSKYECRATLMPC